MIELDDCGKTHDLNYVDPNNPEFDFTAKVEMVIKAPRGTMALFESHSYFRGVTTKNTTERQCQAIEAFMKEHSSYDK